MMTLIMNCYRIYAISHRPLRRLKSLIGWQWRLIWRPRYLLWKWVYLRSLGKAGLQEKAEENAVLNYLFRAFSNSSRRRFAAPPLSATPDRDLWSNVASIPKFGLFPSNKGLQSMPILSWWVYTIAKSAEPCNAAGRTENQRGRVHLFHFYFRYLNASWGVRPLAVTRPIPLRVLHELIRTIPYGLPQKSWSAVSVAGLDNELWWTKWKFTLLIKGEFT